MQFEKLFGAFTAYAIENAFPASTRLVYYALLNEILKNELTGDKKVKISITDIKEHCGYDSNNTIHRAVENLRENRVVNIEVQFKGGMFTCSLNAPEKWKQ